MSYTNKATYDPKADHVFETIEGESMTQPDQSYTVQDLIERYYRGEVLPERPLTWLDEQDYDKINSLHTANIDLTDVEAAQRRVNDMQAQIDAYKKAKEKEAERKRIPPDDPNQLDIEDIEPEVIEDEPKKSSK
jgi:hypothetical protein